MRPYSGPWGGGNRFVASLREALATAGHQVVHTLYDRDIDILLLVDCRPRSPNVTFTAGAILRYLAIKNPNAIAVHRINECDERKGERFINHKLVRANYAADATVFVGEWMTRLPVWREHLREPWFVIRNGSDKRLFHAEGFEPWPGRGAIKLVTHHWGYHPYKGFDVYRRVDDMLDDKAWADRFSFTYIGNLPSGFTFRNVRYVPPLDGKALADALRSHHAYLTASINEPGGNHQNEGATCSLPLIYRESGCLPEYCEGFGIPFKGPDDIAQALDGLRGGYSALVARMPAYPHTAEKMTAEWIALFEQLLAARDEFVARRRVLRSLTGALATQLPL
jgi:hypothetical protein